MSEPVISGEDSSWAQTFVTVTPQDDGFLREIQENVVVSGNADTPLILDTWNVVLRRSLIDTATAWIDSRELTESTRINTECQTYLQGVPKVELPLAYKDEATQTFYIGNDAVASTTPDEYFEDIITVLNDKCLPKMRTTRGIQTRISTTKISEASEVIEMLTIDDSETIDESSSSKLEKNNKKISELMEAEDIVNFMISKTEWLTNSQKKNIENIDKDTQTLLSYNWRRKILISAIETQTKLSCKPKDSNSKLLKDYNETKKFFTDRIIELIEKNVYPVIEIENIVGEIIEKCGKRIDFPLTEEIENVDNEPIRLAKSSKKWKNEAIDENKCTCKIEKLSEVNKLEDQNESTGSIRIWTDKQEMIKFLLNKSKDEKKKKKIYPEFGRRCRCDNLVQRSELSAASSSIRSEFSGSSASQTDFDSSTTSSDTSLTSEDKRVLGVLRNAFHRDC